MISLSTETNAQSLDNDIQNDIQHARVDAVVGTHRSSLVSRNAFLDSEAASESQDFSFSFFGPVFYNSNAEAADSAGTQTVEINPEVRLGWSKQVTDVVTLSGLIDASSDRFVHSKDANSDSAYARIRVQYTSDPNDDQAYAPFVNYSPSLTFIPTFRREDSSSQDLSIGFDKTWNYYADWERIDPAQNTLGAAVWSLGFTGTLARRFLDSSPSLYIVTAVPSLTYNTRALQNANEAEAQWNASFQITISRRLYDSKDAFSRHDWLIQPILTVEFEPPLSWFKGENKLERDMRSKSLGRPKIDFQGAFTRLESNKSDSGFHQWAVGPMVSLTWGF